MMISSQACRQVFLLTKSHLKARYRNTLAGFIWVVINPLILFGAQCIAFKTFLKIDVPNYYMFLLGNLLPWVFAVNCIVMCVAIFIEKRQLLKSFSIDPLILIWAQVLDNFFNFIAAFFLLFIPMSYFYGMPTLGILFLPLAIILLALGTFFLSALFATLNVFFQDTRYLVNFVTSVLFFVTPVFYPIEFVPEKFHLLIELNIFYLLITPVRICLYNFEYYEFFVALSRAGISVFLVSLLFRWIWKRRKNEFFILL